MKFPKIDFWIFIPSVIVYFLGLTILLSIAPSLFKTQLIYGFLAFGVFWIFSGIDYRIYLPLANIFYIGSMAFLLLTFLLGEATRGSVRWIDLGLFRLQPSEIIKPLLVIFVASSYARANFNLKKFILISGVFFLPLLFVLKQPDLGNAIVYFSFWFGILFVSGFKPILTPIIALVGIVFMPIFWRFLKSYQKERILSFIDPSSDPLGIGYNVIQAVVTVGSGNLLGRGLGRGTQSHLLFLPEFYTDFIFASFSEELGFIGVIILLFFYLMILLRILRIIKKAPDKFGALIVTGAFMIIFTQTFINIGMNIGILPITGITLPLVSYGGSSLLSMAILLGIINNISLSRKDEDLRVIR